VRKKPCRKSNNPTRNITRPLPPPPKDPNNTSTILLCQPISSSPTSPTSSSTSSNKKWKRGPRKKCCFWKCENNERTDSVIKQVKTLPKKKQSFANSQLREICHYLNIKMEHQWTLKAYGKKDEGRRYFLCNSHEMKLVTKQVVISREYTRRKQVIKIPIKHTFMIPTGVGVKVTFKPNSRKSKGLGHERL
jgi:hypothetical protein